jgi:hypothetical protein
MNLTQEQVDEVISFVQAESVPKLNAAFQEYGMDAMVLACAIAANEAKEEMILMWNGVVGLYEAAISLCKDSGMTDGAIFLKNLVVELEARIEEKNWNEALKINLEIADEQGGIDGKDVVDETIVYGCENSLTDKVYFVEKKNRQNFFHVVSMAMEVAGCERYHTLSCLRGIAHSESLETFNLKYPDTSSMISDAQQIYGTEDYGVIEFESDGNFYGVLIALKSEWGGYILLANWKLSGVKVKQKMDSEIIIALRENIDSSNIEGIEAVEKENNLENVLALFAQQALDGIKNDKFVILSCRLEEIEKVLELAKLRGNDEENKIVQKVRDMIDDMNNKEKMGSTLCVAASEGENEKVEQLISDGADVNYQGGMKVTPLHVAAQGGYRQIIKVLIEAGANVDARTSEGATPLHLCDENAEITDLLLTLGADYTIENIDGNTAWWKARCGIMNDAVVAAYSKNGLSFS